MKSRPYILPFLLALLVFGFAGTSGAASKSDKGPSSPAIDAFYVDPSNQVSAGTELTFTVEGTPKGQASVKLSGIPKTIPLKEVDRGTYEGSYTIRSRDRLGTNPTVRATLRARGRATTTELALAGGAAPAAAAPASPAAPAAAATSKIERFTVAPVGKIEPGADLKFSMSGTPGAKASFTIEGVARDVPMREVKSGQYEGSYTIRRLDNFPSTVSILGTLESGGQAVGTRLNQPLIADAKPPVVKNLSPREGEALAAGQVSISATFDDSGGVGVDPKSVRITLDAKDVTQSATITPQFFNLRTDVGQGAHQVQVSGKDMAGNTMRHTWSFTVAQQPVAAALPLQILSHANNEQVKSGATEVRGRTAPGAKVDVSVNAVASVAGLFGLNQQVLNQSLVADANGNFAFSFKPPMSVPGTRYEIGIKASNQQMTKDMQLVLFQAK